MKRKKTLWSILTGVCALLFLVSMVGGPIANQYATILDMVLGTKSSETITTEGIVYFEPDYPDSMAQEAAARDACISIEENGAVLLLNRGSALPMKEGASVTLLSIGSADFIYGGTGSGQMDSTKSMTLKAALESDGFKVNGTMWDFYTSGNGKNYRRQIASGALNNYIFDNSGYKTNEAPLSAYSQKEWDSISEYGDAAIVVFNRVCGEGTDLPWFNAGDGDGNILSLSAEERDLLGKLAGMKADGTIKKIVVLLNSSNQLEMDFIEPAICGVDYGIDACLWVGEVGTYGIEAIGDLLCGKVNPSGHLVDTYCYDNLTSPAIQNAHVTSYLNASDAGLAFKNLCNEYYVVYQEGIYVGYRYYETRYEDLVLGNRNVGEYDYASTVAFPFGYGLSYSSFEYGELKMADQGDELVFTTDVTNTSDVAGKEVVQIYMQSPYTDYDRENGVEKASVELVGFQKVSIDPGKTVTVSVSVPKSELRTYDANQAKTYIVDAGNYYFATGNGAHEALNNILLKKADVGDTSNGTVDTARMTGTGRAERSVQYQVKEMDTVTYAKAVTGNAITNQLDHADLNKVDDDPENDVKYVSRADWQGTMPQAEITATLYRAAVQMAANETLLSQLRGPVYEMPTGATMPTMGKEGTLTIAQFIGVELDGSITVDGVEYTWDDLLDQVKFNEMTKLIGQGYHTTAAVSSIGKPATKDENGPQGITAKLTGGASATGYPSADIRAAAYDPEISRLMGVSLGNDCLLSEDKPYSGLYGFGANLHRTPYGGRNFEYYSEDPFISGSACSLETEGLQSKGVYVYLKHFALNDADTGRDGICTWTNEQAARELYLQCFEYPIVNAGGYNVMTSFNRLGCIWAGGDRNLITGILRGECGMRGFALTDFSNSNNYMDVVQGVLAGGDSWDCNNAKKWTADLKNYKEDPNMVTAMREATKHILYTVANSNAMNGLGEDVQVVELRTWWQDAFIAMDIVFGILTLVCGFMLVRTILKGKKTRA
ncbi:MAG: glycoside hydrolase family 3 C-terminal domain-containing protein [Clostridia bacterium]|nr:glycoside hydrolase family 3 C-terminal domain-containing protein [Clostridia bacterium]